MLKFVNHAKYSR